MLKENYNLMHSFKNYTIIKSLGKGGMSEFFLAEDNRFKSQVVAEVLNHEFSSDSKTSERFIKVWSKFDYSFTTLFFKY